MEGGAARGVTPIHAELGDLSWKNCWVTRVAVCRRVALPLGMGEGLLSALGAWRPCGLPVPSPCHSRPEEGAGGAALAICEMSWVRQGWRGSHFQSLPGPATHHQLVLQPCRQHLFFPLSRSTFLAIFQGQFVACPLQKAQAQGEPGNNQRTSKLASNPVLQTPKKSLRTEVV